MKFQTLSLFPESFSSWLRTGLIGQAYQQKLFTLENINPRDFASGVHQAVDDKVYGGGDGMAQSFKPWAQAIEKAKHNSSKTKVVFLTPQGQLWNQSLAMEWLKEPVDLTLVCGRYAGFDERLVVAYADEEISIGDYVLNGGELPAQVLMESLLRGHPQVLGHKDSFFEDSFGLHGLLECPSFTRPQEISGLKVPEFLMSGHHKEIETYRRAISVVRTHLRRPDLLVKHRVSKEEINKAYDLIKRLSPKERRLLGVEI